MNIRVLNAAVLSAIFFISLPVAMSRANDLNISNVHFGPRDTAAKTVSIFFDLSWNNSWRNKINHDAVWLTARLSNGTSAAERKLCHMSAAGLNPVGTAAGSVGSLEVYVPQDKIGAFIRRSINTPSGAVAVSNIMLTVDYSSCGFTEGGEISVDLFGLEMVYIPQGSFYAGDRQSSGALQQGSGDNRPWLLTSEDMINVTAATSSGYYYVSSGNPDEYVTGSAFNIPVAYPKGYDSFYAMKYEISEGQWVYFVNSLPSAARLRRDVTDPLHKNSDSVVARNTVSCTGALLVCSSQRPARAMTYLTWMDLAAFLDWNGLRPMTELELEKIARGPLEAVAGEYAWGSNTITAVGAISGTAEDTGAEISATDGANANYAATVFTGGDASSGPDHANGSLRVGFFAGSSSDRILSGAGYYGVMELSGNSAERVVTIGNTAGLLYSGIHGDGVLAAFPGAEGNADVNGWPGIDADPRKGVSSALGSGFKGGSWSDPSTSLRISDRTQASRMDDSAAPGNGGRGVRTCNAL